MKESIYVANKLIEYSLFIHEIIGRRFEFSNDNKECYDFPSTGSACTEEGCSFEEGENLCTELSGYLAGKSDATANGNMVGVAIYLTYCKKGILSVDK